MPAPVGPQVELALAMLPRLQLPRHLLDAEALLHNLSDHGQDVGGGLILADVHVGRERIQAAGLESRQY